LARRFRRKSRSPLRANHDCLCSGGCAHGEPHEATRPDCLHRRRDRARRRGPAAQTAGPAAPLSLTYKGFNYVSYYNGAYENADSLPALVTTGANAVALDIEYGIDVVSSAVYSDANYTDSLTAVAATITEAKGHGLTVMVRPLIDFLDPAKIGTYSVGDWRSFYNPTNAAAFFASYQSMIVAVAQAAQTNGATILCIGVELDQLAGPAYLTYWTDIVTAVRAAFSGTLVYSANWDAAISPWRGHHGLTAGTGDLTTQISFWSALISSASTSMRRCPTRRARCSATSLRDGRRCRATRPRFR
jgi:hypothetical protein